MKTAIIGGGASGITAAIFAAANKEQVTVFERSDRILKKLLATGNGRCNLSNTDLSQNHYHSHSARAIAPVLAGFTADDEKKFFASIGIPFACEDGRIYPYSRRASAVVDALRMEAERLGVKIICNSFIKTVTPSENGFTVNGKPFDRVIIACGGSASPMFGTDGNAFSLLARLGHKIHRPFPALVPLKTVEKTGRLKGIRVHCSITMNGKTEHGELQFAEYGLSGIAIMQLSNLYNGGRVNLFVDLIPDINEEDAFKMLKARAKTLSVRTAEDFLTGLLHKTLAAYLLERAHIDLSRKVSSLSDKELTFLSVLLKKLEFTICGTCGETNAQTTAGGAELREFYPETLESKILKSLYCCGEALDCCGDCGGYNLHWAWATGAVAGRATAVK